MPSKHHNPERSAWKGRSHKKGGERIDALREATVDIHDGPAQMVCVSCHKLPKFCKCGPDAVATCPICSRPVAGEEHFPQVNCATPR